MPDVIQVFFDLVQSQTRLHNAVGERLRAEHGLTANQFGALRIIGRGDDCRVNDLAREAAITAGAASKVVDRLEATGWVSRRPNPANRRSSLLGLTSAGRQLLDDATPTADSELRTWLAGSLPAWSLDELAAAVARLRQVMEDAHAGMPAG